MKPVDKIKLLMTKCRNIEELIDAIGKDEFFAFYMREADPALKQKHNIDQKEIWHRFWVETGSTPVNKWESVTNYTVVLISDDLREIRVIDK